MVKSSGHDLDTPEKAEAFCERELSFADAGTFGGNTSCVQVDVGGSDYLLCDLGSGVREFSSAAIAKHGPATKLTYHILVSHVHWDHIMGFPYFIPCYIPGNRVVLYSCHDKLEQAIRNQAHEPCFPVEFKALPASIEFVKMEVNKAYQIAGATVTGSPQIHGNDSYGYRIEKDGKSLVYTTDSEHKPEDRAEMVRAANFFKGADLVIFDAMYSLADSVSLKEDWGHSSNVMGVELCQMAGVQKLCLFHHEPGYNDARLEKIFHETIRFEEITRTDNKLDVLIAYDGLVIDV